MRTADGGPYQSFFNSNKCARGVAIFIKEGIFYSITLKYKCQQENGIVLECTIGQSSIFIVCLYLSDIPQTVNIINNEILFGLNILIGGDLNTVLDPNPFLHKILDLLHRSSFPNKSVSNALL